MMFNELENLPSLVLSSRHDLYRYHYPGTEVKMGYIPVQQNILLRLVHFTPSGETAFPPVLFVPGLASVMDNFRETLQEMTRFFPVYYLETREKSTSIITGKAGFSVNDLVTDVCESIRQLNFKAGEYILMGYSLGATAILESIDRIPASPAAAILAEPNASFPFPGWLLFLARFARLIYLPVKPFLKWYLRKFRIDMKNDSELYNMNCRILDSADPARLAAAVRSIASYRFSPANRNELPPTLVIGASKDKFHSYDHSMHIAYILSGSRYLDLETNKKTHGPEIVHALMDFLKNTGHIEMVPETQQNISW